MVLQDIFYSSQKLMRERWRANCSPLRTSGCAMGVTLGNIANAALPRIRSRVAKFSADRSKVGSMQLATQPARGTPLASMASLLSWAWFRQPRRTPTTKTAGIRSDLGRSALDWVLLMGAYQPPAPSTMVKSAWLASAANLSLTMPRSTSILASSAAIWCEMGGTNQYGFTVA